MDKQNVKYVYTVEYYSVIKETKYSHNHNINKISKG